MNELAECPVREAHESAPAGREGDGPLRPGGDAGDPLFARFAEQFAIAAGTREYLAVLTPGDQALTLDVDGSSEQSVMDWVLFVTVIEAVDRTVGQRKVRHAAKEGCSDAMAAEVEGGYRGHGATLHPKMGRAGLN
jgi:hypothetical protein